MVSNLTPQRKPRWPLAAKWPLVVAMCLGVAACLVATFIPRPAVAADASVGIYNGTETYTGAGEDDTSAVELGVKFTVSKPGSITAIRFFKSSANTGTHTGSLWNAAGTRLATVTFTGETASGWQVATLAQPVAAQVGTTYTASYHTNVGRYAQKEGAFANGATLGNATIRATSGVYRYGTTSTLPTSTWGASAYYVDALFTPQATAPTTSATPTKSTTPTPTKPPTTSAPPTATPTSTTPTSTPASCAQNGPYVWANLINCGWPGPTNTGYQLSACPSGLTVNSGATNRTIRVTAANTVLSCQNITGCLSIEAPNVTVKNVKVTCTSGRTGTNANGTSVVYVNNGASATIDHVEINGMSGVHACIWDQGTAMTVRSVNCYGVNDGIFSWADKSYSATTGDNFTIQDSYFHDFTVKTANGHVDGYQTEGAGNGLISHNTYLMTSDSGNEADSAIAIWNSIKNSHDITVQNNLIAGGGFSVYAEDYNPSEANPAGGLTVTKIAFKGNVFSTHLFGCVGSYGVWFTRGQPSDGWNRTGNKLLETGASLDATNPTSGGRVCS